MPLVYHKPLYFWLVEKYNQKCVDLKPYSMSFEIETGNRCKIKKLFPKKTVSLNTVFQRKRNSIKVRFMLVCAVRYSVNKENLRIESLSHTYKAKYKNLLLVK